MSKLDWMYKSSNSVDPEDYLLGKAIDKNFEAQGSSKNEVDKDILPTSIFANSNSNVPVDVVRKIKEDPLEQIKQKEIEMKKQILKNPVKLKKLQSMLKAKEEKRDHKKKKKKSKSKDIDDRLAKLLQKYGTKAVMELTESSDTEEEDHKKSKSSKKTKHIKSRSNSSSDSDENRSRLRDGDGHGHKSSRVQYSNYGETNKKIPKRRSCSDSSSERQKSRKTHKDHRTSRDDQGRQKHHQSGSDDGNSDSGNTKSTSSKDKSDKAQNLMNVYARLIEKHGAKKLMELVSDDSEEDKSKRKKKKKKKSKAKSDQSESDGGSNSRVRKVDLKKKQPADSAKMKIRRKGSSDDSSSEDERTNTKDRHKKQELVSTKKSSGKHKQRASSSSSYSPDEDDEDLKSMKARAEKRCRDDSSDEEKSTFKKAYGLVLPKGVSAKPRSNIQPAAEFSKKTDDQKSKFVRPKPSKLTNEEKEAKLKEMMANAQWRDKERKTNVAKYREEEKREASSQKYDEGFMRKELAKAVDSSKSVEERIKSRMNNVQRSKFSMNQNFARRN